MKKHDNLAYLDVANDRPENSLFQARVVGVIGDWFLFEGGAMSGRAKLSADCFLRPGIGDEILLFTGQSQTFILNVLMRASTSDRATVVFPDQSELTCQKGQLSLNAQSLSIKAREAVDLQGTTLSFSARKTELRSERFKGWCAGIEVKSSSIRVAAHQLLSVFGRTIQRAKDSLRLIDNSDQTRARRVRIHANDHVQVTSTHASIRAQGFVKIDGQKIDLG